MSSVISAWVSSRRAGTKGTLASRLKDVFLRTWHLGVTSFGGPPVHFQIYHSLFVEKHKWIDEQTYQELFAVCQALPGPASTKLGFCICMIHSGVIPALFSFALWSLPGAIGMFFLALGISRIGTVLPPIVYAFLSGLNAATVGIIALAAVQLSTRAITDDLTRAIVIISGCAGMCYNALWYFPALMAIAGVVTVAWDVWGVHRLVVRTRSKWRNWRTRKASRQHESDERAEVEQDISLQNIQRSESVAMSEASRKASLPRIPPPVAVAEISPPPSARVSAGSPVPPPREPSPTASGRPRPAPVRSPIGIKTGLTIIASFFASFITIMVLRSVLPRKPVELSLFSNLYLAGTIIFGGGPVVIPLLREYIVAEGWVSSRDFLIGLALIQSFPGPNFNFAVYLAALAAPSTSSPALATAILGFIGIFSPGLILATGVSSIWSLIRRYRFVSSILRGVNAAAVGLVWTAVYRLWEIGYLDGVSTTGTSLGRKPWWVVVAALAYSGNAWFGAPAPVVIVMGGLLGLAWWGVVGR